MYSNSSHRLIPICLVAAILVPGAAVAQDSSDVVGDWGRGETVVSAQVTTSFEPPQDREMLDRHAQKDREREKARAKGIKPLSKLESAWAQTFATLSEARELPPLTPVRVGIRLRDVVFDYKTLGSASDADRSILVSTRQSSVAASQVEVARAVRDAGGAIVDQLWLGTNAMIATIPAGEVSTLATLIDVDAIEMDRKGGQSAFNYHLYNNATAVRTDLFINANYQGQAYSRTSSFGRQRIAIIEHDGDGGCMNLNYPNPSHIAYQDTPGGFTRFAPGGFGSKVYNCSAGCVLTTATGSSTHGGWVTGVAAQDITEGQDPSQTTYSTRMQRSGIAQEAEIYYYNLGCSYSGLASAIQQAVADNVDVINMSFTFELCTFTFDSNSVNSLLSAALQAGVVPVAAVGNNAATMTDPCEIGWPSYRPDVLAVGSVKTDTQDAPYANTNLGLGYTSLGGMGVLTRDFVAGTAAAVDLVAPGALRRMAINTTSFLSTDIFGSSLATPTVSGAVALVRHAMSAVGRSSDARNGRHLLTTMLLMGDGWNGQDVGSAGYDFPVAKPSRHSGYGRLVTWWPQNSRLTSPWAYSVAKYQVYTGSVTAIAVGGTSAAESTAITELKWAVTWFEQDLATLSDVDISIYNTCPAGGGSAVLIASQTDYDFRNRIRLTAPNIGGKCLELRIRGYSVNGSIGSPLDVHSAYMYHSAASL